MSSVYPIGQRRQTHHGTAPRDQFMDGEARTYNANAESPFRAPADRPAGIATAVRDPTAMYMMPPPQHQLPSPLKAAVLPAGILTSARGGQHGIGGIAGFGGNGGSAVSPARGGGGGGEPATSSSAALQQLGAGGGGNGGGDALDGFTASLAGSPLGGMHSARGGGFGGGGYLVHQSPFNATRKDALAAARELRGDGYFMTTKTTAVREGQVPGGVSHRPQDNSIICPPPPAPMSPRPGPFRTGISDEVLAHIWREDDRKAEAAKVIASAASPPLDALQRGGHVTQTETSPRRQVAPPAPAEARPVGIRATGFEPHVEPSNARGRKHAVPAPTKASRY